MRQCVRCGFLKNFDEFYKSGLRNDGTEMKRTDCIACYLALKRKKRLTNGKPKRSKVEDIYETMENDRKDKISVEMCKYQCSISHIARKYDLNRGKLDRAKYLFYDHYNRIKDFTPFETSNNDSINNKRKKRI